MLMRLVGHAVTNTISNVFYCIVLCVLVLYFMLIKLLLYTHTVVCKQCAWAVRAFTQPQQKRRTQKT